MGKTCAIGAYQAPPHPPSPIGPPHGVRVAASDFDPQPPSVGVFGVAKEENEDGPAAAAANDRRRIGQKRHRQLLAAIAVVAVMPKTKSRSGNALSEQPNRRDFKKL